MKKFEPTFESLRQFECPDWFRNAKFGIWSHWGPQSVPMYGDDYARTMYIQGSLQNLYHVRRYGHPSKFGYKDICAMWKAEKFEPDELMKLYCKAGARYFVGQAAHYDNFFNYPSEVNRFNAMRMGPKKDICGLWKAAAEKNNLPFGLSEHMLGSFTCMNTNKDSDSYGPYAGVPYDGNDPDYLDFYFENYEHIPRLNGNLPAPPTTMNVKYRDYWLRMAKEVIDLYKPDLFYTDGCLPFGEQTCNLSPLYTAFYGLPKGAPVTPEQYADYKWGLETVAHLYNSSIEKYGENHAVYTQKDRREEIYSVGVFDMEKSQISGITPSPWQTDTCIGNWFYDIRQPFKRPAHLIEMLIDIISKNGNMLLNILQLPDGTIDDETVYILEELAEWYAVCGEGVYGTRPWKQAGEGSTQAVIEAFREAKTTWNSSDYRFTSKGGNLYAFILNPAENRIAVITSLTGADKVKSVRLLGNGNLPFEQSSYGVLTVKLPEKLPTKYTNCIAIDF